MTEFFTLMKFELALTVILFVLLFIRLGGRMTNRSLLSITQVLLLLNFLFGFFLNKSGALFDGMYLTDPAIVTQKNLLNLGVYLISLLFADWLKGSRHMPEFLMLMIASLMGLFFLISSGDLLLFFLALELSTIPLAAMANFDLEKRISSEAAIKMILSSAFSSGVLLFGISLLYGATGTIRFAEIPARLDESPLQLMAFVFLFTAFAFKLSVVPFHLWTADVYHGAPVPATSFLSVISKGGVAFVFLSALYRAFAPLQELWYYLLIVVAIATMVIGNLFALRQQNMKRFLAFSSIAQVGFILVGMSGQSHEASVSVIYFILIYIFSNLAAFGVVGVISFYSGKEEIRDYRGLYRTNPFLCWVLAIALFSLAGIPPTAGFFGKLFLLSAGAGKGTYWFIAIAALNMVISLYYYLRVVRSMFMERNEFPLPPVRSLPIVTFGLVICAAAVVLLGFFTWIYDYLQSVMRN
ncbi:MAG TPA: NADH-quinone oxidoreductase subunit N [Chitinophagaceae bacterium]|nr:NADH-quinone oxidoreductase subunit N [Chitinophagaceae bacterium]